MVSIKPSPATSNRCQGIVLLEVMIALVVVSLGMLAVHGTLSKFAETAHHMKRKSLASWIASNKITEFSVAPRWPEIGETSGNLDFANLEWHWRAEVSETQVENLRRVDVSVAFADDRDAVVHSLFGLIEPPPPPGIGFSGWQAIPQPGQGQGQGQNPGPSPGAVPAPRPSPGGSARR